MEYLDENGKHIEHGDIYDIGQTVNGTSKFVFLYKTDDIEIRYLNHYGNIGPKYEYDQSAILKLIENVNGIEEITFVGNCYILDRYQEQSKK